MANFAITSVRKETATSTMNISLPDAMKTWVEEQVKSGRYANSSDYVRDLIRRDQEELAQKRLRELMEEGLNSGPARKMTPADWAGLRKAALGRKG